MSRIILLLILSQFFLKVYAFSHHNFQGNPISPSKVPKRKLDIYQYEIVFTQNVTTNYQKVITEALIAGFIPAEIVNATGLEFVNNSNLEAKFPGTQPRSIIEYKSKLKYNNIEYWKILEGHPTYTAKEKIIVIDIAHNKNVCRGTAFSNLYHSNRTNRFYSYYTAPLVVFDKADLDNWLKPSNYARIEKIIQ